MIQIFSATLLIIQIIIIIIIKLESDGEIINPDVPQNCTEAHDSSKPAVTFHHWLLEDRRLTDGHH